MIQDVFCKILNKELPTTIVSEGENWLAIKDIHPQAPVHILIIPKKHGSLSEHKNSPELLGQLVAGAVDVAQKAGVEETGYRLIINFGPDSQGDVWEHLHIHLLGGKKLGSKIIN